MLARLRVLVERDNPFIAACAVDDSSCNRIAGTGGIGDIGSVLGGGERDGAGSPDDRAGGEDPVGEPGLRGVAKSSAGGVASGGAVAGVDTVPGGLLCSSLSCARVIPSSSCKSGNTAKASDSGGQRDEKPSPPLSSSLSRCVSSSS